MISVPRHHVRRILAVVGIGILAAVLYWAGSDAVLAALSRLSPPAIAVAVVAIVVSTLLGAWNCYRIAELRATLSFRSFLPVFWRSWAVGITLPGQVADFLTTLWQLKGRSTDLNFVAGRLIVDKAITLVLMLALLSLVPLAIGAGQPLLSLLVLAALGAAVAALVALLAWCRRHPDPLARLRLGNRALRILEGTAVPRDLALGNAIVTSVKLLASGSAYWAVLTSITPHAPSFGATTILSQTAGLVAYVPISFNGLGTVEISAVAMFGAVGVEAPAVLSAYIALRLITLAAAWLPAAAMTMAVPSHADP